jgi:hypothetical protein
MVETLMINGISLEPYREDVKRVLSCISKFTDTSKEDVKAAILQKLLELYGFRRYRYDCLSEGEDAAIRGLMPHPVEDKPTYRSHGVCHLNLNGKCLVSLNT